MKGKAKIQEVISHFLRLKRDKRLLKGWLVRRGTESQENNDGYTRLFDELETTQKSALFNVFQDVKLYLVPITPLTRQFCLEMGLDLEQIKASNPRYEAPFESLPSKSQEEVKGLEDESHAFAVFSHIKQVFPQKQSFLNPEVLRMVAPQAPKGNDTFYSPITSDDEPAKKP